MLTQAQIKEVTRRSLLNAAAEIRETVRELQALRAWHTAAVLERTAKRLEASAEDLNRQTREAE